MSTTGFNSNCDLLLLLCETQRPYGFAFVPSRTLIRFLRIDLVFAILAVLLKDYDATVRRGMLEKRIESSSRGSREEEDHTSFTFDLCSKLASLLNSDGVQLLNTKYIDEINTRY